MGTAPKQSSASTIATVVLGVLALIAVLLRFFTRKTTKAGIGADDWWILIGLLSWFATCGVLLYGVKSDPEGGELIDRDSPTFDYAPHITYLKTSFISATLYFNVVTAIKVSILLMYRRVFSVDSFRFHSLLVGAVVIVWWLAGTILTIVSCIPIKRLWIGPSVGGYCFNFGIFWMSMGSVELVIDSLILVLPVGMVMRLLMSHQQKILVISIFLLGGFVIITGLIRVVLGYKPGSQNVAFSKAELWSSVHIGTATICACLPTLRPVLTRATKSISSITSRMYGSGVDNSRDAEGDFSATSAAKVKKNDVEHLEDTYALEPVRSIDRFNDSYSDTRRLTTESGELRGYNHSDFETPRTLGHRL